VSDEPGGFRSKTGVRVRFVMDTSALIRYLVRPGAAIKELIEVLWLGDRIEMVTCPELLTELEGVLKRDYILALIQPAEALVLLDAIRRKAEFLPSLGTMPPYTRDRKDDKFVACAVAGSVDCVITVDKDLLDLETLVGIQLLAPYRFLELYRAGHGQT